MYSCIAYLVQFIARRGWFYRGSRSSGGDPRGSTWPHAVSAPLFALFVVMAVFAVSGQAPAHADATKAADPALTSNTAPAGSQVNGTAVADRDAPMTAGTIGIISGGIAGTYVRAAADLAAVLNPEGEVRLLPIIGQGSLQNINDLLYLKGIDIGIVQADVLDYIQRKDIHSHIKRRIHYITRLYNEEFHVIARSDVRTLADLKGQRVNFGVKGSGTHITASVVFETLGIDVIPVSFDQPLAVEKVRTGDIAATIYVAGRPAAIAHQIRPEDGLHLVAVPYVPELQATYLPTRFSSQDYPSLVRPDQTVPSIAVGAVMAVYNWDPETDRYKRLRTFVEAFMSRFDAFLEAPRHPKWQEVNLGATVPGWTRFQPADEWLISNQPADAEALKMAFVRFMEAGDESVGSVVLTAEARDALFEQFLSWRATRQ